MFSQCQNHLRMHFWEPSLIIKWCMAVHKCHIKKSLWKYPLIKKFYTAKNFIFMAFLPWYLHLRKWSIIKKKQYIWIAGCSIGIPLYRNIFYRKSSIGRCLSIGIAGCIAGYIIFFWFNTWQFLLWNLYYRFFTETEGVAIKIALPLSSGNFHFHEKKKICKEKRTMENKEI